MVLSRAAVTALFIFAFEGSSFGAQRSLSERKQVWLDAIIIAEIAQFQCPGFSVNKPTVRAILLDSGLTMRDIRPDESPYAKHIANVNAKVLSRYARNSAKECAEVWKAFGGSGDK